MKPTIHCFHERLNYFFELILQRGSQTRKLLDWHSDRLVKEDMWSTKQQASVHLLFIPQVEGIKGFDNCKRRHCTTFIYYNSFMKLQIPPTTPLLITPTHNSPGATRLRRQNASQGFRNIQLTLMSLMSSLSYSSFSRLCHTEEPLTSSMCDLSCRSCSF